MTRPTYLSGPMSGYPALNFPAFHSAAEKLRASGLTVINPAELNADPSKDWRACMRVDIKALCDCDAIALLPGWEHSRGASLELHVARELGLQVWAFDALLQSLQQGALFNADPA